VGRAPAFWTEDNARLIREHFVAVSVSNFDQGRKDAVGRFFRDTGMQLPGAGGSQWCVTASGKVLLGNSHNGLGLSVTKALEKWNALPAAERAPGAVKVGELGAVDTQRSLSTPPAGGLILKIYYRAFVRDGGKLRYVTGKDLWHDEKGDKTEAAFDTTYPGLITTPQAQPDHMWLTEAEWKSLLSASPRNGDKYPIPAGITDRLLRWHLSPLTVYGETNALGPKEVRAGALMLTVEAVAPTCVRLRLDGFAKLGQEAPAVVAGGKIACIDQWGYEPRLLGFLEYDPQKKVFTRFDIVALGDHFGRLGICDSAARRGLQPLGITFELVKSPRPADRLPPGRTPSARTYFDPGR
jgi:hypothetical protein